MDIKEKYPIDANVVISFSAEGPRKDDVRPGKVVGHIAQDNFTPMVLVEYTSREGYITFGYFAADQLVVKKG